MSSKPSKENKILYLFLLFTSPVRNTQPVQTATRPATRSRRWVQHQLRDEPHDGAAARDVSVRRIPRQPEQLRQPIMAPLADYNDVSTARLIAMGTGTHRATPATQ
jgi:hypothetical protein